MQPVVATRHFRTLRHTGGNASAAAALPRRSPRGVRPIIAGGSDMRAHQPGSTPIDIPETVPNPAYTPAPAPAPERAPTKVPEKVPEKVISGIAEVTATSNGGLTPKLLMPVVCTENLIRVDAVMESPKLAG